MSAYEGLAQFYDALTGDVDYTRWVRWYQQWFTKSKVPVRIVLDLACGTGTLTCLLAEEGYSMLGVDQSGEMLGEAMEKCGGMESGEPPLFLQQSMSELDLFGTIDACVCSLDSVNYVTDKRTLQAAFRRVHTFLMEDGYFLFDVLPPQRLKERDGQVFVDETEDVFCIWRGSFDRRSQVLTYGMDLFERSDNLWLREQEEHRERAWQPEQLEQMLREAGFATVKQYADFRKKAPQPDSGRIFFVCTNTNGQKQEQKR